MNPYQILGIGKHCTRAEAKEAFRSRAYHAHPDRGGETKTFIRIRRAYEQILAELERQQFADTDEKEPVVDKTAPSPRRDRRSKPPDPNWEPDFVLLDEPPRRTTPPRPRDPNWKPDLILLDDPTSDEVPPNSTDGDVEWKTYRTLFHRISGESLQKDSTWQFGWIYAIGMFILLIIIVLLSFTLFWTDSPADQQTKPLERPTYLPAAE
jgi:curved DNA-binding protein CbpA